MAKKLSVYLDDKTVYKLGDIKRLLEHGGLAKISISQVISYAILMTWRVEFVDALAPTNWSDEVQVAVEKYTIASGGNGGGEQ